jgi:hypothetical protein
MEQPSQLPKQVTVNELGGLNERVSPAGLQAGQFTVLEGLYPSQNGQQSRINGKNILAVVAGSPAIINVTDTFGCILVQHANGRTAYTIDELRGRQTNPNITPVNGVEEEAMSMAMILQEEANGVPGGSAQGYISGTDSSSLANVMYGRRLTKMTVNQSSTVTTFTASTGGSSAVSTAGQFVLAPGTYRIDATFVFGSVSGNGGINAAIGLYNVTNAQFQLDDGSGGTPSPMLATVASGNSGTFNVECSLIGRFVVAGAANTFQFNQAGSTNGEVRDAAANRFGGIARGISATIVNGAAPLERYAVVKILKEP